MKSALGDELLPHQVRLAECYESLAATLRESGDTMAPFERRNAIKALAALWQVMNGLDLEPPQLYDLGG